MLDYCKNTGVVRAIPLTYSRYTIDVYGQIVDMLHDEIVVPQACVYAGVTEFYPELVGTPYRDNFTIDQLIALTYKPLAIPFELYSSAILIPNLTKPPHIEETLHPRNYIWKFPNGIVLPVYPGFRVIPGFTNYVVGPDGDVISLFTGERLERYVSNNGYLSCRVSRDDGQDKIMAVHQLVAFAWCDYGGDVCELTVDHLDGNRLNNHYANLEWITAAENVARANYHGNYGKRGRPTLIRDIATGEITRFDGPAAVAAHFGVSNSSIFEYLHSANPYNVFKRTHLIWYEGFGDGEIHPQHLTSRVGSQPRPLLVKNTVTQAVTKYPSVVAFLAVCGLSRKQVYGNLIKSNQKVFGDILFKYEDDTTDWKL